MAQMTKMIRYQFLSKEDRDSAEKNISKQYPNLRTTISSSNHNGVEVFSLFVESTKSLIYDLRVESLMKNVLK